MIGTDSIKDRQQLLHKHRDKILKQQQELAENLKEIDYKLNIYDAPNASDIIRRELQFVKTEKKANALNDPYTEAMISQKWR